MTEEEAISWIESAVEEIDYAIVSNKSKEVKEHYLRNAIRYVNKVREALEEGEFSE